MKSAKTRIAAIATVLGLGGLAGVALSVGGRPAPQPVAAKPLVRTELVRRTVHVTKHAKPRRLPVAAAPAPAPAAPAVAASSGAVVEEPVTTASSGTGSAEPVTTAASGTGGGGEEEHEVDYEHGSEHEGFDD